jgi:oligoribonuclease
MNTKKTLDSTPFVWIDLEMTGLDPHHDVILEIATIITDSNLNIIAQGPALVIHQPEEVLKTMNEWCVKQHGLSGLTQAVRESTVTLEQAQAETLSFIQEYCAPQTARLCGNSVWQDRLFLVRYMPHLIAYLNYRLIDVTSIKEVIRRWYPNSPHIDFAKEEIHRASPDIQESIKELEHYRHYFFIKSE